MTVRRIYGALARTVRRRKTYPSELAESIAMRVSNEVRLVQTATEALQALRMGDVGVEFGGPQGEKDGGLYRPPNMRVARRRRGA